ncbi:MAG: DUF1707 domain-containing protein [Arachnia sp.]
MALPISSKYIQRSGDPVDDVERDSLTRRLNEAYADGRITHDQYAVDMDVVYGARTLGELIPVVERMPAAPADVPAIVQQGGLPAGQLTSSRNLMPAAILVSGVAVTLLVVIGILLAILF